MPFLPNGGPCGPGFPLDGFLTDLLECICEGVIAADLEGRFVLFNSCAQRLLGLGALDVPSSTWSERYGCFRRDTVTPFPSEELPLARAILGEAVTDCLIHIRNPAVPNGLWINVSGAPLRDKTGVLYGGVAVLRDVTEERREIERVTLLSAVAEQTADAVIITDRQGVIEYVNPAVEKVTGFAADELIGNTPRLLRSGLHTRAEYAAMWDTLLKGDVFRGTLINRRKQDGEIYYSEQTITPIRDTSGRICRFVSLAKDLTDSRRSLEYANKLRLAQSVQQRMYPGAPPWGSGFDVAGAAVPADETGGDYYDFLQLPGGGLTLAVGDVSGHGFDAALYMVAVRAALRTLIRSTPDPGDVLTAMNEFLANELAENRFVTLVLASLDKRRRTLRYASAGHATGFLMDAAGDVKAELCSTGVPLGLFSGQSYESVELPLLEEGDLVALVTDGITEAARDDVDFGEAGVLDLLRRHQHESAARIADHLCRAVIGFSSGPQNDDITTVICKVTEHALA